MYNIIAVIIGMLIALMVFFNGMLSQAVGSYLATVIIHTVGVIICFIFISIKKQKIFENHKLPVWMYLGGVIGVGTTLFNNMAFGHISISSILVLSFLGEITASLIIDQFGFFSLEKRKINKKKILSLIIMLSGIFIIFY